MNKYDTTNIKITDFISKSTKKTIPFFITEGRIDSMIFTPSRDELISADDPIYQIKQFDFAKRDVVSGRKDMLCFSTYRMDRNKEFDVSKFIAFEAEVSHNVNFFAAKNEHHEVNAIVMLFEKSAIIKKGIKEFGFDNIGSLIHELAYGKKQGMLELLDSSNLNTKKYWVFREVKLKDFKEVII